MTNEEVTKEGFAREQLIENYKHVAISLIGLPFLTKTALANIVLPGVNVDVAVPHQWLQEMKENYPDFNPSFWVWAYFKDGTSKPVHLLEEANKLYGALPYEDKLTAINGLIKKLENYKNLM